MTSPGFTVIGGYLGAGKTTLLNRLLTHNEGRRLALLINDFGAINIDASLIERQTESQINLTNGCICCGLSAGFDEAIDTLLHTRPPPDHIVVEASGVADVTVLGAYGRRPGLRAEGIIVVADAETVRMKARDKYVAATVTRQLQAAELIVLNKMDLVSAAELAATVDWLEKLAPAARLITTRYCEVPTGLLLGIKPGRSDPPTAEPARAHDHPPEDPHDHPRYQSWSFRHAEPLTDARVLAFIAALPDAVLRAKGYFRTTTGRQLFQQVGKRWTLTPQPADSTTEPGATELVMIGLAERLEVKRLEGLARQLIDPDETPADP